MHHKNENSPKELYKRYIEIFNKAWGPFSAIHRGVKIPSIVIIDFFYRLGEDLGFGEETPKFEAANIINKMYLYLDTDHYAYFYDVLWHTFKRKFKTFKLDRTRKF
jgi:hypothetical protein